jgi:pyruvate,water dikinase
MNDKKIIVWFKEVDKDDIGLVGGKGANLGEMVAAGFPVPEGFIVTSEAYFQFLKENNYLTQIKRILEPINFQDPRQLNEASQKIKKIILRGKIPQDLAKQAINFYEKLGGRLKKQILVAVRSSATAEDLPDASFAGQQETFLNVKGEANLVNKIRECWASLFTPRAIFYREEKKFSHFKVGIAAIIQRMVQSKTSGVMFTLAPVENDKKKIIIEAIYGLGELIVQGLVSPDRYLVDKRSLKIINKQINKQEVQLIKVGTLNKKTKVKSRWQKRQKITDQKIIALAQFGKKIHQHYFFPQDIEWAIEKNKIYILQTRPVTTLQQEKADSKQAKKKKIDLPLILKGDPASPGIASGYARIIESAKQINELKNGEVLVTKMTTPDFVPAMKRAAAIMTDKGGQTSHAAIVSRELGIACVVGTDRGTKLIKNGTVITLNGKTGEIFQGALPKASRGGHLGGGKAKTLYPLEKPLYQVKTATKLYVNLAEPDLAQEIAQRNVDGVGLLRAEFMISEEIKYHPKKLIEDKKQNLFIEKLSQGIEKFCRAFEPRPVVYRTTDFKTNEYRHLIGGQYFEPEEANPMLGFRGAFRYLVNKKVFELELKAIEKVRKKMGYTNLWLMIPFVRTVEELKQIKKIITRHGLTRSSSFQLWMMVEVPANVFLLEDFIKVGIDGISIGSNDLTMLILGIDRDNENLAPVFDERNEAVLCALEKVIKTCLKNKITCSICGQAPSLYSDLTSQLINWGITSISVSPDMIETTREIIYEAEKRKVGGR